MRMLITVNKNEKPGNSGLFCLKIIISLQDNSFEEKTVESNKNICL